uniref:Uncharacterized protein n=1 Tax=Octopus bimaculoides TaxID=37653 RepID=A0A0L8I1F0_OCTBM
MMKTELKLIWGEKMRFINQERKQNMNDDDDDRQKYFAEARMRKQARIGKMTKEKELDLLNINQRIKKEVIGYYYHVGNIYG